MTMPRPRTCSRHAADRFLERWQGLINESDSNVLAARTILEWLCTTATHVEDCPNDLDGAGQSIWDLHGLDKPVRVAVSRDGEIRTVFSPMEAP